MKKSTIWIIAIVMGLSFIGLLFLQISYIEEMTKMKKEQFDESVNRSLYQASRNLEMNETLRYLEKDVKQTERKAFHQDSVMVDGLDGTIKQSHQFAVAADDGTVYSSFELKTFAIKPANVPKAMILRTDKNSISEASKSLQEIVRNRYVYQKALLDEVVYNILYTASDKPLKERINFKLLDQDIRAELMNNGVNIPYHFRVLTADGREIYRCPDYSEEGEEYTYKQTLFRNDPSPKMGVVMIHFPDMNSYIFSSVRFMIPAMVFTIVLLITFIFTIVVIFRQKRYNEIKNDFINNMTHELKTPISSISLAAQMLNDESVTKSPSMLQHLGGVINDESKRLRFLVEKVLQMSMFDRKQATFKKKELDLNELLETITSSFSLRVEHTGGKIYTEIEAVDSAIFVDEVHFQNAITNLMDNAVKYRKPEQPLDIYIRTWNEKGHLCFSIRDTGLGIKKENVKKIFDKFYRVHTGNVHDVKGFGLGLAYVKKIINLHDGEIKCESELGKGTTFTGMLLREYLQAKGYVAELCADGDAGFKAYLKNKFDICVLDVMMPKKDGYTLASEIRAANADVPIIFLTAKTMKDDILEGFKIGADDYITKPFSMEELVFRIEAILRRTKGKKTKESTVYRIGNFTFDTQKQLLVIGDQQTKLTTKENELLALLCSHANEILQRDFALKTIWIDDNYFNARSMDVYITKLRKHLKDDPQIEIINIHGKGYKLITPDQEA